jgi:DNA-binding HxlR family transcriptional regulator
MSIWHISADDDGTVIAREVLDRLGDRWSVCVIHMIDGEAVRFTELKRKVSAARPISARVLARTLRQLERDGLISRQAFPVIPPRVEYRTTPLGQRFLGLAERITEWTMAYGPDLAAARRASELPSSPWLRPHPVPLGT